MTPFLKQVAAVYASNRCDSLPDFCFVLPNKRSATFFTHFLHQELSAKGGIMPEITNITDFVSGFSQLSEANRYELIFTLFDEYRKIPGTDVDFDRFLFWGEMILSDFNDVDRYLVDADALFVNVRRLREISSNFLTDEQREVIRRFWGEERTAETVDRFWKHLDKKGDAASHAKFVKLWEVLQPLYHAFKKRLAEQGLATSGMLYRNAAEQLDRMLSPEMPFKRYIFVGFNVLSTSEIKIFSNLQRLGIADFYWDYNSPAFDMEGSRAARFISRNVKEFPSLYKLPEPKIEHLPEITITGVPSNVGQTKEAGDIIGQWLKEEKITDPDNAINTAVVLPDESLFIPMLHSIPVGIGTINVTMGFPMRLSPMASLIHAIISLQLRSRIRTGHTVYFLDDVKTLLNSRSLRDVNPQGCDRLEEEIRSQRLFNIPADTVIRFVPEFTPIFTPISDSNNPGPVNDYIQKVCDFLDSGIGDNDGMQRRFVESYRQAANELTDAAERFGVAMRGTSFIKILERAINADTVRFVGNPLRGLQIMGVLETRALDFDNIILLSMNERVFPRKHYSRSFIPDALRHGYGMATLDFQESIYAYYFYRLICRAKNVSLIYDARSVGGTKSNELSRYLAQLLYFFGNENVTHNLRVYNAQRFVTPELKIKKTDEILKKLNRYRADGELNLSASALNTYINCPLEFYLERVEDLGSDNEITDYMDSSTYGTIVHDVMEKIYSSFLKESGGMPVTITGSMILPLTEPTNVRLDTLITESINRHYNRFDESRLHEKLLGESLVLSKVIKASVNAMLRADATNCPFTFVAAEYKMQGVLKINDTLSVNIKQIIDRIDIVNGRKRFVDYKTGSDKTSSTSVESLLDTNRPDRAKAIFQLLLYCHLYNSLNNTDEPIEPLLYKVLDITSKGIVPLTVAGAKIDDYHCVADEFIGLLYRKIEEIFDPEVPFTRTPVEKHCLYCNFKAMCGRK